MKKTIFIATFLYIGCTSLLFSQESKEDKKYKEKFVEYMKLTQVKETFLNSTVGMLEESKNNPNMPKEQIKFLDEFITKIKGITEQELIDIFMPPHKAAFSLQDINQFVKFYSTPSGKKYSQKQSEVLNGVKSNSEKYGQKLATEIIKKYESQLPKEEESKKQEEIKEQKEPTKPQVETNKKEKSTKKVDIKK